MSYFHNSKVFAIVSCLIICTFAVYGPITFADDTQSETTTQAVVSAPANNTTTPTVETTPLVVDTPPVDTVPSPQENSAIDTSNTPQITTESSIAEAAIAVVPSEQPPVEIDQSTPQGDNTEQNNTEHSHGTAPVGSGEQSDGTSLGEISISPNESTNTHIIETGDVLTGDVLTGVTGDILTGDVLTGVTGDILTGDVLTGDVLTGDILTGDILTGDVLTGDILTGTSGCTLIDRDHNEKLQFILGMKTSDFVYNKPINQQEALLLFEKAYRSVHASKRCLSGSSLPNENIPDTTHTPTTKGEKGELKENSANFYKSYLKDQGISLPVATHDIASSTYITTILQTLSTSIDTRIQRGHVSAQGKQKPQVMQGPVITRGQMIKLLTDYLRSMG